MSDWAAIWSAIAATFSAFAAVLLWRLEKLSFHRNARPEIVLTGWSRESSEEIDKVSFCTVDNVGPGSALYVLINSSSHEIDGRLTSVMSTIQESLIAPGGRINVKGEILIWWENAEGSEGDKSVPVKIEVVCWDTTGIRYLTQYTFTVFEASTRIHGNNIVAPGVVMGLRSVESKAVWMLKLKVTLSKLPLIGCVFNETSDRGGK